MRKLLVILAAAAGLLAGADVSGTWAVTVDSPAGKGTPTFVLKQEGEKLSGTYSGLLGEATVTGTVHGDRVEWEFPAKGGQVSGTVKYTGTVSGRTMKGKVILGDAGEGTWEGVKK